MQHAEWIMDGFWELFRKRMALDGYRMQSRLGDYTPSEIHCITHIGSHPDCNVTKLAESFSMTKSGVTKLTKKLMQKGMIESYQKPENKKEIYFGLLEGGQAVRAVHEELHREYEQRDRPVFEQVTEEQLESILRFVERYSSHLDAEIERLGIDLRSGDYDTL